jgi:nitrogenase molybdenum-iron protein NifN
MNALIENDIETTATTEAPRSYVSTTNACKLCTPLGAAMAFQGIEGAIAFLHGSQGCATYMRRYVISHFREPVDIASSSLGEKHAVYGGGPNLQQGIKNVMKKYHPGVIGIATTCLTETIGDDVPMIVNELRKETATGPEALELPHLVTVSTPSYAGTHMEGFHAAVRATVDALTQPTAPTGAVNLLPGFVSPADLRHLKELVQDFGLTGILLPDYAERLDGPALEHYEKIPAGGTPVVEIRAMSGSSATLELGRTLFPQAKSEAGSAAASNLPSPTAAVGSNSPLPQGEGQGEGGLTVTTTAPASNPPLPQGEGRGEGGLAPATSAAAKPSTLPSTAGTLLEERYAVPRYPLGTPIGLRETDALIRVLETISGRELPEKHAAERGRLVDAYVDGHKYIFGKRAVIYGEEDLVIGLTAFLVEIGIQPVLCTSGGRSGRLEEAIAAVTGGFIVEPPLVREGTDFYEIAETARKLSPDLLIGNSKGYRLARELRIPLLRVGFPIHDRFGAQRVLHIGYRGTQVLFDQIVNAVLESNQESSPVGYGYL